MASSGVCQAEDVTSVMSTLHVSMILFCEYFLSPMTTPKITPTITPDEFFAADLRVGRVLTAERFPEARKPAIKLRIDFGEELGVRRSSAQLTLHYSPEELVGRLVVAVVNFPPRQIGPFISEVLVLGACPTPGDVVLLAPDADVPLGTRIA